MERFEQIPELTDDTGRPYVALEAGPRFKFEWQPEQVKDIVRAWESGESVYSMAERIGRDPDEVAVLIMDLRRRSLIGDRPGGAMGDY